MKTFRKSASNQEPTVRHDHRRLQPSFRKTSRIRHNFDDASYQIRKPASRNFRDTSFKSTLAFRSWWTHIWSGFVRDPTGKHYKAIRKAIWLYLYFLVVANWRDGTLFRCVEKIAAETGFGRRSIQRWLRILRDKGYIETRSTGRRLDISIKKWRPISGRTDGSRGSEEAADH